MPDTAYTRLAARYIDAWNARDAADRRALVDEVFTPDARYTDPVADIAGSEAIDGLIAAAQQQAAGLVFTLLDGVEGTTTSCASAGRSARRAASRWSRAATSSSCGPAARRGCSASSTGCPPHPDSCSRAWSGSDAGRRSLGTRPHRS